MAASVGEQVDGGVIESAVAPLARVFGKDLATSEQSRYSH